MESLQKSVPVRAVLTLYKSGPLNKSELSRRGDMSYDRLHEVLPLLVREGLVKERRGSNQVVYELDKMGVIWAEMLMDPKGFASRYEKVSKLLRQYKGPRRLRKEAALKEIGEITRQMSLDSSYAKVSGAQYWMDILKGSSPQQALANPEEVAFQFYLLLKLARTVSIPPNEAKRMLENEGLREQVIHALQGAWKQLVAEMP